MNKKAQTMGLMGIIFTVFIGVIVGLVLFQAAAGQAGETARTGTLVQALYGPVGAGQTIDLVGQELLSVPTVTNRSTGDAVPSANYTIFEGVSTSTGVKTIQYKAILGTGTQPVNISYTYGANGYVEDTGAKSIIGLIVIFAALAVAVIALQPTLRSGVLDLMKR